MADVLMFHHALGQTPGFLALADQLRDAGHTVHTPDLFEGRVFDDVQAGVAFANEIGFEQVMRRGAAAAEVLPSRLVYAGFSLGVMPAQLLAQTRPGGVGALLFHAAAPLSEFGGSWPAGVPLQMHIMEADPWDDLPVCREVAERVDGAELFVYPGSGHLFADAGSPDYEPAAAGLLMQRVLAFLDRVTEG